MKPIRIGCHIVTLIARYPEEYEVRVSLGLTINEGVIFSIVTKDLNQALDWFRIATLLMKALDV